MTISIYKNAEALNTQITRMLGNAGKLKAHIQECLVNAELHCRSCGDVGPLNRIFEGTKEVSHKNTVPQWINKECSVTFDAGKKAFVFSKKKAAKFAELGQEAVDALIKSDPYWSLAKADSNPFAFDLPQKIAVLVKQAEMVAEGFHPSKKDGDGQPLKLSAEEMDKANVNKLVELRKVA